MITGQLFFRDANQKSEDGRRLIMVVGVIAIGDNEEDVSEVKMDVTGVSTLNSLNLTVLKKSKEDMSENNNTIASTAGDLLLKPIWKV